MYFFIEKYKISHQMVTFPWKELPDFHIFSHHVYSSTRQGGTTRSTSPTMHTSASVLQEYLV